MKRQSGILLPVSALPGPYGCGAFGASARAFVRRLAEGGFSLWQVLPFCLPDECQSPYKSLSTFSVNPYFIDLDDLRELGLLTWEETQAARQRTPYACEYDRLGTQRLPLLRQACRRMTDRAPIDAYLAAHPDAAIFCEFMGRRAAAGGTPWYTWRTDDIDREEVLFWQFLQYTFDRQWRALRDYAASLGVGIIGDIPMYVAEDSADVWANREDFQLDKDGRPTAVAGVPPDYFSRDGQLWGNPLYNYRHMKQNGFSFWRRRMAAMAEWFDGVRIDHFRAIESYYRIPVGKSAKEGTFVKGPGMPLLRALREAAGDTWLIAEDLGDITPAVRRLLERSGLPGMRVLQFAFLSDAESLHQPHMYHNNCVAYTGTHDNNTLLGYMFEQSEQERERLLRYIGRGGEDFNRPCVYRSVLRTLLASAAGVCMFPIQDILMFGADTRINTPGVASGNWTYRLTEEQLQRMDLSELREMNRMYGRC